MSWGSPPFLLRLLPPPHVATPGGPADLPLGKPLAALCYLALEPTGVERTDLARILWPGSPESRARASIRQALWLIRKQTHPDLVQEENGSLALDPALIRTDLDEFDRAITAERLDDAIELWGHGPLHGFSIPGRSTGRVGRTRSEAGGRPVWVRRSSAEQRTQRARKVPPGSVTPSPSDLSAWRAGSPPCTRTSICGRRRRRKPRSPSFAKWPTRATTT